MDCSSPGSPVKARILEWVALPSTWGASWLEDWPGVSCGSCAAGRFFSAEPPEKHSPCIVVVWYLSRVQLFATPWLAAHQASLSFTISPTQTHVHWVSDAIQPFCPLSSLSPSAPIFPSIRVFSNKSALRVRWPKYWSFSFSNSPSNDYSGLFSFRIDWFDLPAVQGTLLQPHSSKASILQHSAFFMVQLSHPYTTMGKIVALTRQTFVGIVMSLLFNMLSRFVIAFLSRSKCLSISWLQSPSAVILEPKKIKSVTVSPVFPHLFATKWWDRMPWS